MIFSDLYDPLTMPPYFRVAHDVEDLPPGARFDCFAGETPVPCAKRFLVLLRPHAIQYIRVRMDDCVIMELWKQPLYISELPQTSNSAIPQCIIPQFHISTILHDGFGQDEEWVAANFTNATEIAAAGGYDAWVDAQVGEGLTNGLYKLTVSVTEDPLEVVNLSIGDSSIAITNAGEYVFLLGKGVCYPFSASSDIANGFQYSVVDDVPAAALRGSTGLPRK